MTGRLIIMSNLAHGLLRHGAAGLALLAVCAVFLLLGHPASAREANETIRIAAIYSLTGPAAADQEANLTGARLAVDTANQQGGVLGRQIELVIFDNRSMPIGAKKAAEDAVKQGVVGIVGLPWTNHALAAAKVAQENRVPMISCHATHPQVTQIGSHIFRACYTDTFQGHIMAQFAQKDLDLPTVAILRDITSDYSMFLASVFRDEFLKLGGTISSELDYKPAQMSFDQEIDQIKIHNPVGVFIPGHHESGLLARLCQERGAGSVYLGGDGWTTGSFLKMGGAKVQRGYYCTSWSREVQIDSSIRFLAKHGHRQDLNASLALAYDATSLMIDAIKRAGQADRQKIRDALADTRDFEGVTGTITFDSNGDPVKGAVIMAVQKGQVKFLKQISPK